jgi:hypothetical protein
VPFNELFNRWAIGMGESLRWDRDVGKSTSAVNYEAQRKNVCGCLLPSFAA